MPLNDVAVKKAKPTDTPYKLADEKGLYLLVNPTGGEAVAFQLPFRRKAKNAGAGCLP